MIMDYLPANTKFLFKIHFGHKTLSVDQFLNFLQVLLQQIKKPKMLTKNLSYHLTVKISPKIKNQMSDFKH